MSKIFYPNVMLQLKIIETFIVKKKKNYRDIKKKNQVTHQWLRKKKKGQPTKKRRRGRTKEVSGTKVI